MVNYPIETDAVKAVARTYLKVDGWAAIRAGMLAGAVFLGLELFTAVAFGAGTPFGPAHVTLHGLVGKSGLPERLDPGLVLAGVFLHFVLSLLLTAVLAVIIHRWRTFIAVPAGALMGYFLYFVNFILFAFWITDLHSARDFFMLADYTIFGGTAAWFYKYLQRRARKRAEENAP